MKNVYGCRIKGMATGMALVLLLDPVPTAWAQQSSSPSLSSSSYSSQTTDLPDSPGALHSVQMAKAQPEQAPTVSPQTGTPPNTESSDVSVTNAEPSAASTTSDPVAPASVAAEPPQRPHEPVGTAAAESVPVTGVAASRPAGAAVAPAKQRRMRSILIKVGAVVGVGVAVGTTMALSQGSPSRPPGSR